MIKFNALLLLVLSATLTVASARDDAFAFNRELGRGINLGNMFEAPSETAWGNPVRSDYLPKIAELGFSHVRIPIRWEPEERSMAEPPYTISPQFLDRIDSAVEQALDEGLHVIINMHHHDALLKNPMEQKPRFLAQWKQIAERFAGHSEKLVLEIFNEPNGAFTPALWNEFAAEALAVIRQTNPTRMVMIGTADWGGIGGLSKLKLPEDEHLIVTVHYYSPFLFTHQGAEWSTNPDVAKALGTEWSGADEERAAVRADLLQAKTFSREHGVPIHVGEFGAYSRADLASRARWTAFVARAFEENGFSWAYWEWSAGFGIYNRTTGEMVQPLVDALLSEESHD